MSGLQITGIIIASIVGLIYAVKFLIRLSRRREYRDWQINDVIYLDNGNVHELLGWNSRHLYIRMSNGSTREISWSKLDFNKSADWRRRYISCKKAMGKDPAFSFHVSMPSPEDRPTVEKLPGNNHMIDGKPIDLLTEIECQIYLKQCLESQDFETAELIKQQMTKYR